MNWKKKFNLTLLVLFLLGHIASAQVERTKKIDHSFDGKSVVELKHKNGPLIVQNSPDGKVHVHAEMVVQAKTDEAADAVFSHFELDADDLGDHLEITTGMDSYSRVQTNRKTWIKFGDGPKIYGVKDFDISVVLQVPSNLKELKLENKYDEINIREKLSSNLKVELYSGKLNTKDIDGTLEIEMKYGEARVGKTGAAKLDIYDSNLWLGEIASAEVESKYSEFDIAGVEGDLKIETYDDKWEVGHVNGLLAIKDKYSEFEFASLADVEADIYDAAFEVGSAGAINIDESKYSEYKFGKFKSLTIYAAYDDDIRVKEATSIVVKNSKYTEYRVEKLHEDFTIEETYDDTVDLNWVSGKFKKIYLDGKYTELEFSVDDGAHFEVNIDMKYGSFDFDEDRMETKTWREKDSQLFVKGFVGGESDTPGGVFTLKGYDNDVDWN